MATPFKRLCVRAARSHPPSLRPFSSSPTPLAKPPSTNAANPSLTPFPAEEPVLDPVYEDDDISSLGHAELDQHRELREMVRIAAWEMPALTALHKRFKAPDRRQLPLRWRYTTYMGESHPAARKVVVEFRPQDLPELDAQQKAKLLKLAGPRWNPRTGVVKMSCESFETQAQNKRFLGDTIEKLVAEARDTEGDSFADVPLDTRHVKAAARPRFPTEWLLTVERKAELEALRRGQVLEEGRKVEGGLLVSGVGAIERERRVEAKRVEEPIMAAAKTPVSGGKMGRKEMGQLRVRR
ncbi:hypothetical protein B0A50_02451 [Salinomyces thailandicus]|uniref:Small ribosomal subunit protein mS35 mitochondrial conserved domain-containing protein n=1 Tax=Salinomyces thailandicus TaxID=706561 RepID=A0A4U0U6B6_9PEZI|nr:hypothetical protein B0A50_02451 [Salinomyces thailandica]